MNCYRSLETLNTLDNITIIQNLEMYCIKGTNLARFENYLVNRS